MVHVCGCNAADYPNDGLSRCPYPQISSPVRQGVVSVGGQRDVAGGLLHLCAVFREERSGGTAAHRSHRQHLLEWHLCLVRTVLSSPAGLHAPPLQAVLCCVACCCRLAFNETRLNTLHWSSEGFVARIATGKYSLCAPPRVPQSAA